MISNWEPTKGSGPETGFGNELKEAPWFLFNPPTKGASWAFHWYRLSPFSPTHIQLSPFFSNTFGCLPSFFSHTFGCLLLFSHFQFLPLFSHTLSVVSFFSHTFSSFHFFLTHILLSPLFSHIPHTFSCLHFFTHTFSSLLSSHTFSCLPLFLTHFHLSPLSSHTHSVPSLFFLTLSVAFGIQKKKHIVPFQSPPPFFHTFQFSLSFFSHIFSCFHFFFIHFQLSFFLLLFFHFLPF